MFSKVIEYLEQNIRKYLNRLQKTVKYQIIEQSTKYLTEIWKSKAVRKYKI